MKLPFEFGIKLIFRLVLPGFLLTLGLYPAIVTLREDAGWDISVEYLLVFSIIITGWLMLTLDQPIYMFLEGRRFWLTPIRTFFIRRERARLKKVIRAEAKFYQLSEASTDIKKLNYFQRYIEASVEKRKFPLDANGQPEAKFPTRLGNLIDSYESYPSSRYGVEAIFHWYRIWLRLDKDLREELDNRQALADSSLYASIALFISGLLWLVYWLLLLTGSQLIRHVPMDNAVWMGGVGFVVISYLMYRAALYPQAQYGESFKSVFDVHEKELNVTRIVERVADLTDNPRLLNQRRPQQFQTAWRYLHNYKVRCPEPECSSRFPMSPEDFKIHYREKHKAPAASLGVPNTNPYREDLKRAYILEKVIFGLKVVGVGLGLLLLAAGIYRTSTWFVIWAIILNLGLMGIEAWIRMRQKRYTVSTFRFECIFEFPHPYENPESNFAKAAQLLLPYILLLLLSFTLLILGLSK